jgi:hypothetical protein
VASHASARSKRIPGAGKEKNKSALRDFKHAKMADRDIGLLMGQRANMEGQRRTLRRTARNLRSELALEVAEQNAVAGLRTAHIAAESAIREARNIENDLPSTVSSVDSAEAERMLADRSLTPGEQALLDNINFGSDSDGSGVRRTRRKSRRKSKSHRKSQRKSQRKGKSHRKSQRKSRRKGKSRRKSNVEMKRNIRRRR